MGGIQEILNDGLLTLALIFGLLVIITAALAIAIPMVPVSGWRNLGKLFLGVEVPPALVAWVRLLVTGAVSTLVIRIGDWAGVETPDLIVTTIVGSFWGILDQWKKSQQNNFNPPPVAGGTDIKP